MNITPRFLIPAVLWTGFLCAGLSAGAQELQADSVDWKAPIAPHPRILLLKGEEDGIKTNIQSDACWKKIHRTILAECDKMLKVPPLQRVMIGKRLLGTSRECLRRVFFLSYAWRMTHEDRYLKRAEAEMLAVCAFSDWNPPQHFLDVAEMTMAVSIGYDWLYDGLSEQSRSVIKTAIVEKGIEPSLDRNNNSWLTGTNNWNQVCNTGMAYGALAIYGDSPRLAAAIINRAIRSVGLPMKAAYAPDGAYPEGYGYWGYGTGFNVMLISALEKAFGKDFGLSQRPGFLKTAFFMENMTGPTGKSFNYSDSGPGWEPQPAMVWFAQKLKDPSLLFIERNQVMSNKSDVMNRERMLPAFMVWGRGIGLDKMQAPASGMYEGGGNNPVAMMRTSWTDHDALYLALKAGTPKESHGHMDAGSFVMDADGVRWAMDLGMQDYESLESKGVDLWNMKQNSQRWQVMRYNNFVHNTLTVNNGLQNVDGYAPITSHSDTPLFMNAVTDMTSLYNGDLSRAVRGVALVNKAYVAVKDELETAAKGATVRWTMLTAATVEVTGNNRAVLTKDGKKLLLEVVEPAEVNIVTWPTAPLHSYDAPNPGTTLVGFEVTLPAGAKQSITVLLVPEKAENQDKEKIRPLAQWPE
jgi:hypothetical protein